MSAYDASQLNKIAVIWALKNPEVAKEMVLDNIRNFKLRGFWDQVRLVMWGPSVTLFAKDEELQSELAELKKIGVEVQICKRSTNGYDVTDKIASLKSDLFYMEDPFTEYNKEDWATIIL